MFTGEIRRARSKRPLVIGLIFVALVIAVIALVPMPHPVPTTFTLVPSSTVEVLALREGVIAEVVTVDGSMVAKGTVIAKYDVSEAEKQLPDAEKKVATLEQRKASGGKVSPAAKAALAKAEGAVKSAKTALEKATKAGKGKQTPAMAAAQKKLDAAQASLTKAQDAVGPTGEALEQALTAAQAEVAAFKAQLAEKTLVSPGTGLLFLALEKGANLKKDAKLGEVKETAKLRAVIKVPAGEKTDKGMAVELNLGGAKRRVTLNGPATGDLAEAELDNAKGEFKLGTSGDAVLEGEQRSLLAGMM